jgi:hypothetical protein
MNKHMVPWMAAATLGASATLAGLASGEAAAQDMATVTVVHGVPGVPVDVYVDGKVTLPNFQPETVSSPLSLPPGTYQIAVLKAGSPAGSAPLISGSATLSSGENASVVANLNAAGTPTLTTFVNDTSSVPNGQGRLVVRHTAAAPAVDVLANGQVALSDLSNGDQQAATLTAGTISAAVALHGSTTPVIGPANVNVASGSDTIVYAVGSASANNLGLVTQSISGLGAMPSSVTTGNSPVGTHHVIPIGAVGAAAALALLGVGASVRSLRLRRIR